MCFNESQLAGGLTGKDAVSAASTAFAFGALGPVFSFIGQGMAASQARNAQREAVKQNRMNALSEADSIYKGLAQRDMQRSEAAAREIEVVSREANLRLARSTVAAAEAGTSGQSVQDVANSIRSAELGYTTLVRKQEIYAQAQSLQDRESAYNQAAARISGYQLPPVAGPSPFSLLAGLGSTYLDTLRKYSYGPGTADLTGSGTVGTRPGGGVI